MPQPGVEVIMRYDGFNDAKKRVQNTVTRGTQRMLGDIRDLAEQYAAVDTGYMASHIVVDGTFVKALAFYSGFVEWGTRFMSAQPFMRPAAGVVFDRVHSYMKVGSSGLGVQFASSFYGGVGQMSL